ncbi:MAG TPA: hypothetical protein VMG10_26560 [Gemmataceae bacterium]|nr:hypothetical protein [Gemmataceae bacterium]
MRSIANVLNAFTNLAASVNSLAGVIDAATARLRLQLAGESEPPEVLEHQLPEVQAPAPGESKGRRRAGA